MGRVLKTLARTRLETPAVFDRRFVVEVCERVHVHYRNLRLQLSLPDFVEVCQGLVKAYERWRAQGCPEPAPGQHLELCRRQVARDAVNDGLQVNLNENLYVQHAGRIYAEGAGLDEPVYIHLKIRDLRLELTLAEFRELARVVKEADGTLAVSHPHPVLQAA